MARPRERRPRAGTERRLVEPALERLLASEDVEYVSRPQNGGGVELSLGGEG